MASPYILGDEEEDYYDEFGPVGSDETDYWDIKIPEEIVQQPTAYDYPGYVRQGDIQPAQPWEPYGLYTTPGGGLEPRIAFDPGRGLAPLHELAIPAEDLEALMGDIFSPFLSPEEREAFLLSKAPADPFFKATSGVMQGVANTAESLTSPVNAGLLVGTAALGGLPVVPRVLSGAFMADMAQHVPEQARELGEAWESGDPERIAKAATELGTTGAFSTAAGSHALRRPMAIPGEIREAFQRSDNPQVRQIEDALNQQARESNAIQEPSTAETYGRVSEQPRPNEALPAQEGRGGVPPSDLPPGDAQSAQRAEAARAREIRLTEGEIPTDPVERANFEQDLFGLGAERNTELGLNGNWRVATKEESVGNWRASVDEADGTVVLNLDKVRRWVEKLKPEQRVRAVQAMFLEEGIHGIALKEFTQSDVVDLWGRLTDAERRLVQESYGKIGPDDVPAGWSREAMYGHEYLRRQMGRMLREPVREKAEAKGYQWLKESAIDAIERVIIGARRTMDRFRKNPSASKRLDSMLTRMQDHIDAARKVKGMEPVDWEARTAARATPEKVQATPTEQLPETYKEIQAAFETDVGGIRKLGEFKDELIDDVVDGYNETRGKDSPPTDPADVNIALYNPQSANPFRQRVLDYIEKNVPELLDIHRRREQSYKEATREFVERQLIKRGWDPKDARYLVDNWRQLHPEVVDLPEGVKEFIDRQLLPPEERPVVSGPRALEKAEDKPPLIPALQGKSFENTVKAFDEMPATDAQGYKGKNGQNMTGLAWDLGSMARTPEDVALLKKMAEDSTAKGLELMKAGDMQAAMNHVGKQSAEAYEFATGVKVDGTPKWSTFEKFVKGYKPPVPDPKYTAAKAAEAGGAPGPSAPRALAPGQQRRRGIAGVIDAFKVKARQALPRLEDVSKEPLPDLGNRQNNKTIANEPTGLGRVPGLGWLLDPRQKSTMPHEKAILTWFYENAVGQAHVQALEATFGTKFKELFPRKENGELANVKTTEPGQSLHPSDVFEGLQHDPNSYVLSAEQRAGFNELMRYERKLRELADRYDIGFDEGTGEFVEGREGSTPYWTRGRTLKPGAETRAVGGGSLGGRQFFQKGRTFETEQQGVAAGFEYPLSVDDRLIMRAGRLYKAIADRRLAKDPDLVGRWGGTPTYEEAQIFQPAFQRRFAVETPTGPEPVVQHKIFPIETANALNKAFGPQASSLRRLMVSGNNFLKALALGFDFGASQIQGLATAYKNPGNWARANITALKAFASRNGFANYARQPQNLQAIRELAQYGSGVGRLPEMLAGLESGELLTAGPRRLGKAIERAGARRTGKAVAATAEVPAAFARQFQTFMDVAKIELWKARREVVPREEWAREIQAIESQLMSGRMEAIGVRPGQALLERMFLLSPSYYRGALNLIGGLAERGASGQTYRRAMGAYMLGATATFAAMALAAGLSWDEIRKRLNPAEGNFMMVPVKTGGRTTEIGFGGIMRSLMRLGGEVTETSVKNPGNWKSLAPKKNPIVRWLRGHSAPIPSKAWDAFSGSDYMDDETDLATLGRGTLPLTAQQLFGEKQPRTAAGVAAETAGQFLGVTTYPGKTSRQKVGRLYRDWLEKQTDDPKLKMEAERSKTGRVIPPLEHYRELDRAILNQDKKAIMKAIQRARELSKDEDILERMMPVSGEGREMRPKPFFGSAETEDLFLQSLTEKEREDYQKAIDERLEDFHRFLDVWNER